MIALFLVIFPIVCIDAKVSEISYVSKRNYVYLFFVLIFFLRQAQFHIIGKKAVCSKESEMVHNVTCGLTSLNRTASLWSIDVNFDDGVVIDSIYVSEIVYFRLFRVARRSQISR